MLLFCCHLLFAVFCLPLLNESAASAVALDKMRWSTSVTRATPKSSEKCISTNGTILERPADAAELIELIRQQNPACTCEEHDPKRYQCTRQHKNIRPVQRKREKTSSRYETRQNTGTLPTLVQEFAYGGAYEATYLARAIAKNMLISESKLSTDQRRALRELRAWNYQGLGASDASSTMPNRTMVRLLRLYSRLFFFRALDANFTWRNLDRGELGHCDKYGHIRMDTRQLLRPTNKIHERIIDRIGTLLHEAIHALPERFARRSCPTYRTNVENAGGHGRAFMIIATAMEEACERLLGQRIDLNKEYDWLSNWDEVESSPSLHDLSEWKFRETSGDEEMESDSDEDSDYEDSDGDALDEDEDT